MRIKILIVSLVLSSLASCTSAAPVQPSATNTSNLRGRITFAGSTTVQPLADKLGKVFRQHNPNVVLDIAAGGSVVGIKAVHDGTADIGMSSRALSSAEAQVIQQYQIATDVLAIVVNAQNPIDRLTRSQLRDIYLGKLTNWKEVGGSDQPITALVREKSSGTRGAFDEIALDKQEPTAPSLKAMITAGDVAAGVAADPAAIGYVGFGNLESNIKLIMIDNVLPTPETANNGTYPLVRPLLLMTGPLSLPLAKNFIDFVLSAEGQKLVEEDGWVPVK